LYTISAWRFVFWSRWVVEILECPEKEGGFVRKWSCTLEVVTPMFLAGADQTVAELRPPTFKGLMRWWYRAAKGDLITSEEGFLFGSTKQVSKYRVCFKDFLTTFEKAIKEI